MHRSPLANEESSQGAQPGAPSGVQFDQNTVRLVFKHEVQVLEFVAF
jgi:hypothetical protein